MIGYEGAARYARLIQALTGDDQIVPPGLLLESDRFEYRVLKNEQPWFFSFAFTGTDTAKFPTLGIYNTQPNQAITVLEGLIITSQSNGAATRFKFGFASGLSTASNFAIGQRDSRRPSTLTRGFSLDSATDPLSSLTGIAIPTAYNLVIAPIHFLIHNTYQFVLVHAGPIAGTETVTMTAWGYERTARPEELVQ